MTHLVPFSSLKGRYDSEEVLDDTKTDDVDDIVDLMNEDEEDDKVKEDKEDDEQEEDKDEESDDEEEKLEEPEEEEDKKEEENNVVLQGKRQDVLKAYPDIFKKFPWVEHAIYRNNQYSEVFPTLEEAKDARQKAEALDIYEEQLQEGNIGEILKVLKDDNKDAFNRVVDDYLTTLGKVDREAYHHVASNLIRNTVALMVQEARKSDDKALESAAALLNKFIFNTTEYTAPTKLAKEKDDSVDDEKKQFYEERYKEVSAELYESATNQIKSIIDVNIDRNGKMSGYTKRAAIRDVLETVESQIKNDTTFRNSINSLWKNAFKNKFSVDSRKAIKSAYLNKAKSLLPDAIKKARKDALKGDGGERAQKDRKGPIPKGGPSSTHKKEDGLKKGESVQDFFMRD